MQAIYDVTIDELEKYFLNKNEKNIKLNIYIIFYIKKK